jgi:multicomponent Na+:H+ antiporter subunit G
MGEAVAATLVALGTVLVVASALGVNRFDDVFCRMHAATKAATLGVILLSLAAMLRVDGAAIPKLGLVIVLQLLTAPLGAHLLGRAAHQRGELSTRTVLDELADPAAGDQ